MCELDGLESIYTKNNIKVSGLVSPGLPSPGNGDTGEARPG